MDRMFWVCGFMCAKLSHPNSKIKIKIEWNLCLFFAFHFEMWNEYIIVDVTPTLINKNRWNTSRNTHSNSEFRWDDVKFIRSLHFFVFFFFLRLELNDRFPKPEWVIQDWNSRAHNKLCTLYVYVYCIYLCVPSDWSMRSNKQQTIWLRKAPNKRKAKK